MALPGSPRLFELREGTGVSIASVAVMAAGAPSAYTTFRTYGGTRVVRLARHLLRLEESIALEGGSGRLDERAVRRALRSVLQQTQYPESRLRLTFTPPVLVAAIEPFEELPPDLYERGVSCVTIPLHRENPHAKDTRFIATAQRAHDALPAGVHEGLMVAEDGAILEGLSSNFFAVVDGGLRTERERALFGVTRSLVLEVSQGVVPLDERAVRRGDLASVLEAFITSVSRGILPVVEIDRSTIGEGKPGPVTRTLMQRLARLIEAEAEEL